MSSRNIRFREFAGMVNRAREILVPVYYTSKGEEDDQYAWLPITKATAKALIEEAREKGVEEIEGVSEVDGCLYIDGPGDDSESTNEEEEEDATEVVTD